MNISGEMLRNGRNDIGTVSNCSAQQLCSVIANKNLKSGECILIYTEETPESLVSFKKELIQILGNEYSTTQSGRILIITRR
jgi:hypothetical protein